MEETLALTAGFVFCRSAFTRPAATLYAVDIEGDLRAVFYVEQNLVVTVDIGTHDIYKS